MLNMKESWVCGEIFSGLVLLHRNAPKNGLWESGTFFPRVFPLMFPMAAIFFLHLKAAGEGDGDELDKEYVPWAFGR